MCNVITSLLIAYRNLSVVYRCTVHSTHVEFACGRFNYYMCCVVVPVTNNYGLGVNVIVVEK